MPARVDDLLRFPFLTRSRIEQQQIVARGRPVFLNNLPMLSNSEDGQSDCNLVLFEKVPWLTHCEHTRKFFCWTCLLFMSPYAMLKSRMTSNVPSVLDIANKHECSEHHMENTLKLQIFISENFRTSIRVGDRIQHNLTVKKNREVLKRLIDAVCCAVIQKNSHGDDKYSFNLLNTEDCLKFLQLLRNCDKGNVDLVDGAIDLLNRNPKVANDLVDAITRVVKMAIKNETHKSTYVSLILSEHGAHSGKSQISTVLRYIKRGKVCERFVGFRNVVGSKCEKSITKLVLNTIEEYSISDRFLALSLDGAVLPKQSLTTLIAAIKIDFNYSYFVPWHSHGFGNVLLQSLSVYEECGLFFKTFKALENFFRNNTSRFESFELTLFSKYPELQSNKWYETAPFITFVGMYRINFIEFFDSMIKNCKYWDADDVTKATAFRDFLGEFHNVFLLQIFLKLFSDVFDETFNFIVESKKFVFGNPRIPTFKKDVGDLQFDSVWACLTAKILKEGSPSKLILQVNDENTEKCNALFQKILRHIFQDMDIRCNCLNRLKFCDLLNCNSAGNFCNFGSPLLTDLMVEHGLFFEQSDLKSEMAAVIANAEFCNKSVHELLEYLADLNLRSVFPQLYKLSEFILTLPYLPASCGKVTSKLKHISDCSYIPENAGIPSGEVSFLCVETEMLREIKCSDLFYEDVLRRFYAVNQSLLLVQV